MSSGQFYEILQKLPFTQPVYVESATSLDDAKNRLKDLRVMFPGDYFILDCENSCFIVPFDSDVPMTRMFAV
jgi:hypothetical protein